MTETQKFLKWIGYFLVLTGVIGIFVSLIEFTNEGTALYPAIGLISSIIVIGSGLYWVASAENFHTQNEILQTLRGQEEEAEEEKEKVDAENAGA